MDNERAEVERVDSARYDAMLFANINALSELLDERLIFSHSNAAHDTKLTLLRKIETGAMAYSWIHHSVKDVLLSGDSAAVVGTVSERLEMDGEPLTLHNSTLSVWVRKESWRLLAFQQTPIPESTT